MKCSNPAAHSRIEEVGLRHAATLYHGAFPSLRGGAEWNRRRLEAPEVGSRRDRSVWVGSPLLARTLSPSGLPPATRSASARWHSRDCSRMRTPHAPPTSAVPCPL